MVGDRGTGGRGSHLETVKRTAAQGGGRVTYICGVLFGLVFFGFITASGDAAEGNDMGEEQGA